jgi:leucyl aminopeptidase
MTPKIILGKGDIERQKADAIVLPIGLGGLESDPDFKRVDGALNGKLRALAQQVDFTGRMDQVLECTPLGLLPQTRVVLIGIGNFESLPATHLRNYAATAIRVASSVSASKVALLVPRKALAGDWRSIAEGAVLGAYRFTKYLTKDSRPKRQLESVILCGAGSSQAFRKSAEVGQQIAQAVAICRDAVNEPANVLTPATFAERAAEIARRHAMKIKILDKRAIDRAGMHLLAAVGRGSVNEPKFVHVTYSPKGRVAKRIVFLGKGLTFDSGGLCIKPAAGMDEMKNDMAGAAAVLGLMEALGAVRPKVEVHGLFALAENMPDGNAYRPGDVLGSLDGKTVEIINTDAEGRLALADGLAYARRLRPDLIVDAATLTGACMVALGKTCSAYYTTDDALAEQWRMAATEAGELFWRMPLLPDLRDQLKSDIADLKHTGDRWGGSITAALFLKEFVGNIPWIHCDIAGPVVADRPKDVYPKGATGHPVLTFLSFVEAIG